MTSEAAANSLVLWLAQIFVVASEADQLQSSISSTQGRNDAGSIIR
jgi:hypothetical protein